MRQLSGRNTEALIFYGNDHIVVFAGYFNDNPGVDTRVF
jgi:hypothetical protein